MNTAKGVDFDSNSNPRIVLMMTFRLESWKPQKNNKKYTKTFQSLDVTNRIKNTTAVPVSTMIIRLAILLLVLSLTIPTTCPPNTSATPNTRNTSRPCDDLKSGSPNFGYLLGFSAWLAYIAQSMRIRNVPPKI